MVASTSKAQAGPRSVCLHFEGTSCVGMVANKGSALQANLAGPGGALLSRLSDIQNMIQETQSSSPINYVVCMPIQPSPSSIQGGVKGALLLGLSSAPEFSARRAAGIAALCSMLSESLAHSSPAVICKVETMIGRHQGCGVCSPDSDDETELEEEEEVQVAPEPCNDDDDKSCGRKDKGGPPRQSMLIPIEEGDNEGARSGNSSANNTPPKAKMAKEYLLFGSDVYPAGTVAAAVAPKATTAPPPAYIISTGGYTFSKPVTASVTRESLRDRHPLTLTYADSALESEFSYWFQDRLKPVDFLFSMLVATSIILLAYCRPIPGGEIKAIFAVWDKFVAVPLLIPVLMAAFCRPRLHQNLREIVIALVRMYLVVAASRSAVSQSQASQQQHIGGGSTTATAMDTAASFLACWIAAGGETLLTPALGLQMRLKWHVPLQTAAVAVMCYNVKSICGPSFYQAVGYLPHGGIANYFCTVAAAGLVGLVLPTLMLRVSETRSRRQFEAQISAAAGITTA
jgi:uncharacterized membrane protein YfcA